MIEENIIDDVLFKIFQSVERQDYDYETYFVCMSEIKDLLKGKLPEWYKGGCLK